MKIRKATLDDLKSIQELNRQLCDYENKTYDSTITPDYPLTKEGEEYFKGRIKNDFAFVAEIDDKIVGYQIGAISDSEDYRKEMKIAEAENIFVLEEFRSQGIGKKLLEKFKDWAKGMGANRARIVSSAKNERGHKLYRHLGFEDYDLVMEADL